MADHNTTASSVSELENQLNSFDRTQRAQALTELARRVQSGAVRIATIRDEVNLHYHTFFSYNANDWSPSRIAWEARKYGLAVAGIVDFDVLDGMEEFLLAGDAVGLRSTAAVETRVFISEYSDQVINSPNEPGIAYFMAAGCFEAAAEGTEAAAILGSMREMARRRTVQVMERVNDYLDAVRLDYDADILPLTPSGNATERHMLAAYDAKSRQVFTDDDALAAFWAGALGVQPDEARVMLSDTPQFHEKMRSKLMKFGGVGYVPPTPDTFPTIERVIEMAAGMGAVPTAAWLDGTNPGEADMPAMLALLASKDVAAINIIPDRNWNIKDPEQKRIKVENLGKAVQAARDIGFPLCVGTEMNKGGLPFVDDFSAPELQPYVQDFLDGAFFFWGHTFLGRAAGIGCASDWAKAHFDGDAARRNRFYTDAGRLANPAAMHGFPSKDMASASPEDVLKALSSK